MMIEVIKRDGKRVPFKIENIVRVITRAMNEVGERYNDPRDVAIWVFERFKDVKEITVEQIQDHVEEVLMDTHPKTAKAYILYRQRKAVERENPWADNDERQDMILQKYLKKGETKAQFIERISLGKSSLAKIFRRKEALWGGRNLYAIGRPGNITGSNCYVTKDPEDNLEDIYRADYEIARTYSYGGGQGMNISKIRPKGMKVNNSSATTPGPMVFAEKYSHTTLNTQQDGRRGALMLVMNVDHPDVIDFATAKLDLSKINGANISLAMTDAFMEAYENDKKWNMSFSTTHESMSRTVEAKDLMNVIAYAAHTMGDPGVLFIDNVNRYHLLSEYDEVNFTATNPCGEQPLMAYGSCNLASINLNAFVRNPYTDKAYFDFERFRYVVTEMTWGLDDLLTLLGDRHALQKQRQHVTDWREIGLGVMGLADLALSMGFAYGSENFLVNLHKIMRVMINTALKASALYAKEKGVFPKYDYDKIRTSSFFLTVVDPETQSLIKQYGLRNSRLLSIAPTGSISNVLGVSGGVEPFFQLNYTRRIISLFETERTITVWEKAPLALAKTRGIELEDLPEWAKVTSQNISIDTRLKVQATIQRYVDTAISSTFNLPNEATTEDVIKVYVGAWKAGLKGVTVFRDRCAKIGILAGVNDSTRDDHPAVPPTVNVVTKIKDQNTDEVLLEEKVIKVGIHNETISVKSTEVCPVCGAPLIKKNGCTACSACEYEKCAL